MPEPTRFTARLKTLLIRLLIAVALALGVLGCFWIAIWFQPPWGYQPSFQAPPWGEWPGRDRLLLTYGSGFSLLAVGSAILATLPLGPLRRSQPDDAVNTTTIAWMGVILVVAATLIA